jgi:putative transposase
MGFLTLFGTDVIRAETILAERQRIKRETIANRRLQHQLQAA